MSEVFFGSKNEQELKEAPAGWLSSSKLCRKLNLAQTTVVKKAREIASEQGKSSEWIGVFLQKGKEVELYSPELINLIPASIIRRYPENWLNITTLASLTGWHVDVIKKIVEPYRNSHSEWFGIYGDKRNRPFEYFHPDLVEIIHKEVKNRVYAPEGWQTVNKLAHNLKISHHFLDKKIRKLGEGHPEWLNEYVIPEGQMRLHIHPELIKKVIDDVTGEHAPGIAPDGWKTNSALAADIQRTYYYVQKIALQYQEEHPEWFSKFTDSVNKVCLFYHPDLVDKIKQICQRSVEIPPKDWVTVNKLARQLNVDYYRLQKIVESYRIAQPESLHTYVNKTGRLVEFISPQLVKKIEEDLENSIELPAGWLTIEALADTFDLYSTVIHGFLNKYRSTNPEWFAIIKNKLGKDVEIIYRDAFELLKNSVLQIEKAPIGWQTLGGMAAELRVGQDLLLRLISDHLKPDNNGFFNTGGLRRREFFSSELKEVARKKLEVRKQKPPKGWLTTSDLVKICNVRSNTTITSFLKPYRKTNPDWFIEFKGVGGRQVEHCHPELVALIKERYSGRMLGDEHVSLPPPEWINISEIVNYCDSSYDVVRRIIKRLTAKHLQWTGTYLDKANRLNKFYHPNFVKLILLELQDKTEHAPEGWLKFRQLRNLSKSNFYSCKQDIEKIVSDHPDWTGYYLSDKGKRVVFYHPNVSSELIQYRSLINRTYDYSLEDKLSEFLKNNGEESQRGIGEMIKLIGIFGPSRCVDLLYKFRPEFRGLPVERVSSILTQYLGDFLVNKYEFNIKDVGLTVDFLSEHTFREGLYEAMKDHCLHYYFEQRKQDVRGDAYEIIYKYIFHIVDALESVSNEFIEEVIEKVGLYFASAIRDFHKPDKFITELSEGREFPDLNQKINMKELADKKRMLIADEMGLGKSASVIMAKEHMKVGCALVVVPSNVTGTWQDYLSDDRDKRGYFKTGQAPRVLVVGGIEDLNDVTKDQYDYIVISHEKLNGRYAPLLEQIDPDMLIVDEVHKLKNVKAGKKGATRSRALMPVIRKLEKAHQNGENRYLALLSGTPIPNKVRDIAFIIKLLYPERFGEMQSAELVRNIIHGDIIDLRALLVPHMQMKELEDAVEMPKRDQKTVEIELSRAESDIYEALLELDELTAQEKMQTLRQYLLNPALLDSMPGIEGSKISALRTQIIDAFKVNTKVAVIVNGYVTDVMRGKNNIIDKLGLPPDIKIGLIHGGAGNKEQRPDLQNEFNNSPRKMLLVVSGQTADVGISLVGAERTIIYNEPWTESDLRQQKARVFRPGLKHDIVEETLIVKGTIEEGIHEYIARKHKAIEKILKGVPLSELEQRMLAKREDKNDGEGIEFEVNPELARTYYSWRNRLTQMFGHTKENGEELMLKFLETWGADYAEGYRQVGARSYQSNTNRVAGTLIDEMIKKTGRHSAALEILDVASGPEMLRRHIGNAHQASISSLDINPHHFKDSMSGKTHTGSWRKMPFKPRSFDYLNCAMAFQDSAFAPSKGKYERLDVLREMNRVLKPGGRAVISMIFSMEMKDMGKFKLFAEATGFHVVQDYSGQAEFDNQFASQIITLEKFADVEKSSEDIVKEVGAANVDGLKMFKTNKSIKNDREILTGFLLDGKAKIINLNDSDRAVLREEKEVADLVKELKRTYGAIKDIPAQEIIDNGFVRILAGKQYFVFKRLVTAQGVVILK